MPSMAAPRETRNRARSWTCGSDAALRRPVVPLARTAAMSAFSVPVTLGSSRKMSAPLSFPSSLYASPTLTSAPSRSSARKCVSTRRRPMTSPPGGGSVTRPKRASIGPASRIEARISLHRAASSGFGSVRLASTSTVFVPCHCTVAPTCCSKASRVSTSRMRGTLSMRHGPSARRVAARIGRAAFLLPAGRIVPERGRPPVTRNDGGIGSPKLPGRLRLRQAFANVGPRASRACAGARHHRRYRRHASVAALLPSPSLARRPPRDGRAVPAARPAAGTGTRGRRCRRTAHAPARRRARDRMDRCTVRRAPRMADGAAHLASHLADRSDARPSCPPGDDGDGVVDGARASGTRRSVGPAITPHCPRAGRSPDDCRKPARPETRPPQRTARHCIRRGGSNRRGRALSSPSRRAQPRADSGRGGSTGRPVRRAGAWRVAPGAAGRRHRGVRRDLVRRRLQLRGGALAVRRVRAGGSGLHEFLTGRGAARRRRVAGTLGAPAVRRLPYGCRRPAPPADGLAADGRGGPRLDPRAGALGDGAIRSRSSGPRLAVTALRAPPGICLLRHTPGRHGRRTRGGGRPGGGSARPPARHNPAERDRRRGNRVVDPVDSTPEPGRGFVMLPTWVGVVSAISLTIIALAALVAAGALLAAALGVRTAVKALKGFAGPAIADVRQLIGSIKTEADALVGASRDVRQRIVRAVDAAEERLTDLDSLAEVMQEELEETALDAAATMRDVRRGLSVWRWSRKLLKGKKRR